MPDFVLIDVSNSFTKLAFSSRAKVGRVTRIPTADLTAVALKTALGSRPFRHAVVSSVVPALNAIIQKSLPVEICWVGPGIELGFRIDYPKPETIGADRLANVAAGIALYGVPLIVVDFGTAVTFDVLTRTGTYIGGIIAPGVGLMTEYLHHRTALLPRTEFRQPRAAIGRSTRDAMRSGTVHGYCGMVQEILKQIRREQFSRLRPQILATGGDAKKIGSVLPVFDAIVPGLTLEGLRIIGARNLPA